MPKFVTGDKVLVNRAQVATIHTWDEENNFLIFTIEHKGGAPEYVNGHITSYDVEYLVAPAVTGDKPESVEEELAATEPAGDEYTTAE